MSLSLTSFWINIVAMVVVACVFILVPLYKFNRDSTNKGLKSNWYKTRLAELKEELASGQFSQQEYDEAVTELKLTATDELRLETNQANGAVSSSDNGKEADSQRAIAPYLIAALVIFIATLMTTFVQYGEEHKLEEWRATLDKMPALSKQVLENSAATPTEQDLKDFALGLRTRLANEPSPVGWMLLGRTLNMLRDLDGAIDAFDKSLRLEPSSGSTIVSLGQALQERGEPGDYRRSIRVLRSALELNPQNLTALILFAEGKLLDEQYASSLDDFTFIDRVVPPNDPRAGAVKQRIAFLKDKLGLNLNAQESAELAGIKANAQENPTAQPEQSASGVTVNVEIRVEQNVDISQFSHLFVFAKSPEMPMPLAVKKLAVSELADLTKGITITLTEQDVMMPTLSLASQSSVDVFARLSLDEQAPFVPGDLQAQQTNIALPTESIVKLTIIAQSEEQK